MTLAGRTDYPDELALYIGGEWCGRHGRETMSVANPATGETLAELPLATDADLSQVLGAARDGFARWREVAAQERARLMLRAAGLLRERSPQLARTLTLENGKPLAEAAAEIERAIETIEWCAEESKRIYGRVLPAKARHLHQSTLREPIGPVAAFAPWNFPAVLVVRKVAAALAAGCSVVVKAAEECPAICMGIVRAFHDAGVPPGVVNLVFGKPAEVSRRLISSEVIAKVSFTGSVRVGRELYRLAGEHLKPVTMELGGHAPVIVGADVDVPKIATLCCAFKFRNAGQVCIAPARFLVHESIQAAFLSHFAAAAQSLRVGNGMDPHTQMGPLNNARRLAAAEAFVANASKHGAKLVTGGERIGSRGHFFPPTVLSDVRPEADVMREEPFCPVAPILPFSRMDEAISIANSVDYGLAAYAFTDSLSAASELAESLQAGWIGINNFTPALADAPLGGMKHSGIGYEGGPEGLAAYVRTRFLSQSCPP